MPKSGQEHDEQATARTNSFLDQGGKFRRRALLWWPHGVPHSVLVVKKRNDTDASYMLQRIADWCVRRHALMPCAALSKVTVHQFFAPRRLRGCNIEESHACSCIPIRPRTLNSRNTHPAQCACVSNCPYHQLCHQLYYQLSMYFCISRCGADIACWSH